MLPWLVLFLKFLNWDVLIFVLSILVKECRAQESYQNSESFCLNLQVIVQELRESGIFTSVVSAAHTNISKDEFLSSIESSNTTRGIESRGISSRKIGNSGESQATARKVLETALTDSFAVPPLSPPSMTDIHLDIQNPLLFTATLFLLSLPSLSYDWKNSLLRRVKMDEVSDGGGEAKRLNKVVDGSRI